MTPILAELITHINQLEALVVQQDKRIVELQAELAQAQTKRKPREKDRT